MGTMNDLASSSSLYGSNAPFVEALYDQYLADPATVPDEIRRGLSSNGGPKMSQL